MSRKHKNGNGNNSSDLRNDHLRFFSAKTQHQKDFIRSIYENIITIGYGCAGTGKSMCSIGIACQQLHNHDVDQIVVCKPLIGCDHDLGTLPGTVNERIHPYMHPMLEYFDYFLGKSKTQQLLNISITLFPIELIRGHTYNNSFIILDEAQNCTIKQFKLFLSRIGTNSKIVVVGDSQQSDIQNNGLEFCINNMRNIGGVGIVEFDRTDVLRHPIIPDILDIFTKNGV